MLLELGYFVGTKRFVGVRQEANKIRRPDAGKLTEMAAPRVIDTDRI